MTEKKIDRMDKRNRINTFKAIILLLILCPIFVLGQEFLEMPRSTHTENGVPCSKLSIIKEIEPDFNEDLFFAMPWKISVGNQLWYVYDTKLLKVFIFDDKFKYIGQFLESGRGPGEVFPGFALNKEIYAGLDGKFYVHDAMSDRIIQFSENGKYIKDILVKRSGKSRIPFPPVINKNGFFYAYSINNGIVDKLDPEMNVVHTYLNLDLNWRFVVYRPPYEKYSRHKLNINHRKMPGFFNTMYDISYDGHLIIYLFRSSTVFFFKGDKLVRQFDVFIDRVLPLFKKKVKARYKKKRERNIQSATEIRMFSGCFVSKDEPYFYLQYGEENITSTLYKFDFKGKLLRIFNKIPANILSTKNGLYYGLSFGDRHPIIFKEDESK